MAITASDKILSTMLIPKGLKKVSKIPGLSNIVLQAAVKGSMTEVLMLDWIQSILKPHAISNSVLVLDDFADHKTEKVKEKLKSLCVAIKIIT